MSIAHWVFLLFVCVIILTLIFRKPPILPAAIGLFGVGFADRGDVIGAIQISFRALSLATGNLLTVILLIGIVVALTRLLKDTNADQFIVKPLLKIRTLGLAYWVVGVTMWILTLLIWPTPAITLLGAVIIPALAKVGINPIVLAVSLTIFGEGLGLAGDFIIQGAPSLLSKATGIPIYIILSASFPIVILSGSAGAAVGWFALKFYLKRDVKEEDIQNISLVKQKELKKVKDSIKPFVLSEKRIRFIAIMVISSFLIAIIVILVLRIRGDGASALIGGVTLLVLCIGTLLKDGKGAFTSFVDYIKEGLRFAMGVFVPIVIMSSFFFLGTKSGFQEIFQHEGFGFFSDYAYLLSEWIPLSKWTVGVLIMIVAILGSMDGSGFSSLPLVGGISVALSQAAGLPAVPIAVLGQVVGIWTGAALIPWGFSAVTAAVAGVDVHRLIKYTFPAYCVAIIVAFGWTMLMI
jgi:hypothetical protein